MTARPLVQRVEIDVQRAQAQITALERQLADLERPVNIPVDIESDQGLDQLRRDIALADNQTVDVQVDVDGVEQADDAFADLNREIDQTDSELRQVSDQADRTGRDLDDAGTRGSSAFRGLGASVVGFAGALAAFQGFQAIGRGISAAISAASDFEESISKSTVVFGDFQDEIEAFARTGPQALGLSTAAALEATATFGNLFVALGLTQQAAADLAPDIIQLAADLASFNNIQVAEAVEKLRAGLVGEVEPLRTLGVNLNAALVEAKALELGLTDASGKVTEAGKVQARYALILEQTATAQGDFARTADGVANSQRTLSALLGDAAAEIGQALLPAFQKLLDLAPTLVDGLAGLTPVIAGIAESAADAAPKVDTLADVLQALGEVGPAIGNLFDFVAGGAQTIAGVFLAAVGETEQLESGLFRIGRAIDDINVAQVQNDLVNALQAGVAPADALANALGGLAAAGLDPTQIQAVAQSFTEIAGVDLGQMQAVADAIRDQGEAAGLEAAQIEALVRGIFGLVSAGQAARNAARGAGGRRDAADDVQARKEAAAAAQAAADATLTEVSALETLGQVADESGRSVGDLLLDVEGLPPELQTVAAAVDDSTAAFLRQMAQIDNLGQLIGVVLPGTMEEAAAALKDAEGEIVTDFDEFVENLRTRLEARQAFESNLAILRALGLDDLANVFDEAGLPSAQALADAIASPEKLAEAQGLLEGEFGSTADNLMGIFAAQIEGSDLTKTALIDNILTAAALADDPSVRAALTALAESLALEIPVKFGDIPNAPEEARRSNPISPPPQVSHPGTGGVQAGGGAIVTQNFYTEPVPTSQTQQAAQQAAAILG